MCLTILTTSKPPILLLGYCNILSTDFLVSVFISVCIFHMVKWFFSLFLNWSQFRSLQSTKLSNGFPFPSVDLKGLAMTHKTPNRLAPIIKISFSIFLSLPCFASVTLVFLSKHFSLCTAVQFYQHYSFSSSILEKHIMNIYLFQASPDHPS